MHFHVIDTDVNTKKETYRSDGYLTREEAQEHIENCANSPYQAATFTHLTDDIYEYRFGNEVSIMEVVGCHKKYCTICQIVDPVSSDYDPGYIYDLTHEQYIYY